MGKFNWEFSNFYKSYTHTPKVPCLAEFRLTSNCTYICIFYVNFWFTNCLSLLLYFIAVVALFLKLFLVAEESVGGANFRRNPFLLPAALAGGHSFYVASYEFYWQTHTRTCLYL